MAEEQKSRWFGKRRWKVPHKRAKGYAEERRAKVHKWGPKEGKELTDFEAGLRSGYLQCQTDHAETYKFKMAKQAEEAVGKAKAKK